MPKVLVLYFIQATVTSKRWPEPPRKGAESAKADVTVMRVPETVPDDLLGIQDQQGSPGSQAGRPGGFRGDHLRLAHQLRQPLRADGSLLGEDHPSLEEGSVRRKDRRSLLVDGIPARRKRSRDPVDAQDAPASRLHHRRPAVLVQGSVGDGQGDRRFTVRRRLPFRICRGNRPSAISTGPSIRAATPRKSWRVCSADAIRVRPATEERRHRCLEWRSPTYRAWSCSSSSTG